MRQSMIDHPAGSGLEPEPTVAERVLDQIDVARNDYTETLDKIADWVARHADDIGGSSNFSIGYGHALLGIAPTWTPDEGNEAAYHRLVAALAEIVDLSNPDAIQGPAETTLMATRAKVGPVNVWVDAPSSVCEKVQVGTRTVEVPDPDAPMVEREEPVYEWRCAGEGVGSDVVA